MVFRYGSPSRQRPWPTLEVVNSSTEDGEEKHHKEIVFLLLYTLLSLYLPVFPVSSLLMTKSAWLSKPDSKPSIVQWTCLKPELACNGITCFSSSITSSTTVSELRGTIDIALSGFSRGGKPLCHLIPERKLGTCHAHFFSHSSIFQDIFPNSGTKLDKF